MTELSNEEFDIVNGGAGPLLVFYIAYTTLGPAFALGLANGLAEK
jgi:hypothetical protein